MHASYTKRRLGDRETGAPARPQAGKPRDGGQEGDERRGGGPGQIRKRSTYFVLGQVTPYRLHSALGSPRYVLLHTAHQTLDISQVPRAGTATNGEQTGWDWLDGRWDFCVFRERGMGDGCRRKSGPARRPANVGSGQAGVGAVGALGGREGGARGVWRLAS